MVVNHESPLKNVELKRYNICVEKSNERLRVFFTCASAFIRRYKKITLQILSQLDKQNYIVLHDWVRARKKQQSDNSFSIYSTATSAIKHSDFVVAEISFPSTSVGEQITFASSLGIQVVCLYDKQIIKTPSRYLVGTKSKFIEVIEYNREKNLESVIKNATHSTVKNNFVKFNFISTVRLNALLDQESKNLGLSKSHLLRSILQEWFERSGQH